MAQKVKGWQRAQRRVEKQQVYARYAHDVIAYAAMKRKQMLLRINIVQPVIHNKISDLRASLIARGFIKPKVVYVL